MVQEFWVDIDLILEETEKVLLKERTMFIHDLTIFAGPTDDSGWSPRCDLVCSESLVRDGEGRMSRALRRLQCFVRLGMMSIDLAEIAMRGQEGARCRVQCRDQDIYEVNELIL